jgi:wyosine [tRNA(Phe)-imidazoG37] synthetase (radical SAM superfamily)
VDTVRHQVREILLEGPSVDYVTLGGSGEPTLNSHIGSIITALKAETDLPVAVLTNSSLLWDAGIRDALLGADVVLPSLDAYDAQTFEWVNRPHESIGFERMVAGLIAFGEAYKGRMWLEIFALAGINVDEKAAAYFKELIARMGPEKIHVNTAVRPTAETYARRVEDEALVRFCHNLGERAELIVPFQGETKPGEREGTEQDLMNLLARRPCTLADISLSLNMGEARILKCIESLVATQVIETAIDGATVYYRLSNETHPA